MSSNHAHNSSASAAKATTMLVSNPYAVKKSAPELFQKPLEDYDDFFEPEQQPTTTAATSASDAKGKSLHEDLRCLGTSEEDESAENDDEFQPATQQQQQDVSLKSLPQPQEQQQQHQNTTDTNAPLSLSLPLWKRLPSNTISFGSAEILTVSEVARHARLYTHRSVRTTGVLLHKYRHQDNNNNSTGSSASAAAQVSLVLQDPLFQLTSSLSKNNKQEKRRASFGPTNLASSNSSSTASKTARRPSLGMARNHSTPLVSRTPAGATNRKRIYTTTKTPIANNNNNNNNNSLMASTNKFRTPGLLTSSRKQRPSSIGHHQQRQTPKSSQDAMIDSLVGDVGHTNGTNHSTVWIVCHPDHVPVDSLQVGDLVTVFGTMQEIQQPQPQQQEEHPQTERMDETTTKNDQNEVDKATVQPQATQQATQVSTGVRRLGNCILERISAAAAATSKHASTTTASNTAAAATLPNSNTISYVQARIVRVDNGANLRLQQEALQLRRKHLFATLYSRQGQQKQKQQQNNDDGSANDEEEGPKAKVFPGCGPPPYHDLNKVD